MTDKELVQQRIDELEQNIRENRKSGRTYRAVNKCIDELFNKPKGSMIHLIDDDPHKDATALRYFANEFAKRMQRDFPDISFKVTYPEPGVAIAVRYTDTYQETARKRVEQWKKKLTEMPDEETK